MENEEKEDLLLEVSESEDESFEKEEIDYYIEKKILDYIQNEKPKENSGKKTFLFILSCFLMFVSSSILIICLPVYLKYSSLNGISTYSKLVTLSFVNVVLFGVAHVVGYLPKCWSQSTVNYNLYLGDVLKVSFLFSSGSIIIFWLADGDYLSCHLKDPLKGSSVVFSLIFYFVFSRIKMSLEKTFCAITIIVGVFISVDFGICDKFQCHGNSNLTEVTSKLHFLYVIFYIVAHGIWVLHFSLIEVAWSIHKGCSPTLNVSMVSNVSSNSNQGSETLKPSSIQSLSLICQEEQEEQRMIKKENVPKPKLHKSFFSLRSEKSKKASESSLYKSMQCRTQLSVPDFHKFPMTSTPNNEIEGWQSWTSSQCSDFLLWQHLLCCLFVLGICWFPTLSFSSNSKGKLLADVVSEAVGSFGTHCCWSGAPQCVYLPVITFLTSASYVVLILCSIQVLKMSHSAVSVVSIMMAALPMASLFWSLFRLSAGPLNVLEFNPEITGEAVCAVLGFPIIGIGIVLLIKSNVREFRLLF